MNEAECREQILQLVEEYAHQFHKPRPFVPGSTFISTGAKIYGAEELRMLVDASLDFWLTSGRYNSAFEKALAEYQNVRFALSTNSGSSANLLAVSALTSPKLGERALQPGDEVLTVAVAFPTTVNPLLLYGLTPVFVDVGIPDYNILADRMASAITPRTKAIFLAHTLGNPFDLDTVMELAAQFNLWVVEDACDALGSLYAGRKVGGIGHMGTLSCYPAHHITTGEGGAVFTNEVELKRLVESFRNWGRDCWCETGQDNSCKRRFDWKFEDLPVGYDHKFVFAHAGFNLKITDLQAAVGLAQMGRIESLHAARRRNFNSLYAKLEHLQDFVVLPRATPKSDPSWFGFPLLLTSRASGKLNTLMKYLEQCHIGTRIFFAGNITRHPYFQGRHFRVHGDLNNSDRIMHDGFWLGIHPGITEEMLDYMAEQLTRFFLD